VIALLAWLLPQSPDSAPGPTNTSQTGRSLVPSAASSPAPGGRILFPRDVHGEGQADRIPQKTTASGTANIPPGHGLWLFVGFPDGGNWFPANGDPALGAQADFSITINSDGTWRQPDIEFGGDGEKGKVFDLLLADVGPEGVGQLADYFKKQNATGTYVGIGRDKLAADIRPLYVIAVQRET
jgi:hypothetical protein